jgi:hypoxanthine phosphoribosyltransferase
MAKGEEGAHSEEADGNAAPKVYVDATSLLIDSVKLARQVWDDGYRPDYLIGVWRGGTPPGVAIHEFLRTRGLEPYHTTIKTQSYSAMQRGGDGVEIKGLGHVIDVIRAEDRVLIVDDVFDTGHTMVAILDEIARLARRNTPECRIATVYYKPEKNETEREPDYYTVADNRWIVFPHEIESLTDEELRVHRAELYRAVLAPGAD